MNNMLTLNEAGSLLLGAGLVKVGDSVTIGLLLVLAGALLKVGVAVLNKYGVPVSSNNPQ